MSLFICRKVVMCADTGEGFLSVLLVHTIPYASVFSSCSRCPIRLLYLHVQRGRLSHGLCVSAQHLTHGLNTGAPAVVVVFVSNSRAPCVLNSLPFAPLRRENPKPTHVV